MRARLTAAYLTAATLMAVVAVPASAQGSSAPAVRRSCAASAGPGWATCFALRRTDVAPAGAGALTTPSGYGPADLRAAYRLPTGGGAGATVAVVDAYDDPTAATDLAAYRAQYGLPACGTGDGCLRKVNQNGAAAPLPTPDAGWAGEISLDLDVVSAICPDCRILLVEADSNADSDLFVAEDQAVALGARFVSNSWGGDEWSGQTQSDAHFRHPGVAITASTGDNGTGSEYPATSRYVTAVGGTSLRRAGTGRGWTETAWSGAGSGCSAYDSAPTWQTVATGCARRAAADVSAVADPATGVAVYDTYGDSGWQIYGGTSVAAPLIAAIYALAGTPGSTDYPAAYPYAGSGSLYDVTAGGNGSCGAPLCTAGTGWDGPTGLGTPNGTAAFAPAAPVTGTAVAIRAHANGDYVTADSGGAAPLIANRGAVGAWEQFDELDLGGGYVALRAHANGRYVTASGPSAPLIADATSVGTAQQFQVVTGTSGSSLRARADGDYVTAENGGAGALVANRTAAGVWEGFDLVDPATAPPVPVPPSTVLILNAHADGRYVTADNGGAAPLIANRGAVGAWEQFDVVATGDGYVALRAHANGRYVTADNAGTAPLIANRTAIGTWEKFQLWHNGDGSVSLKAAVNGRYVTAESGGAGALIANRDAIGTWEEFN